MPEGMSRKKLSMSNRQDGVPTQGDQFHDHPEYKWHDFFNNDMPPPGYATAMVKPPLKLSIDFEKPDCLYYYLPEVSTEAKVFFTDVPGSKTVCAKANFMDRVQPAKPVYQYQPPAQKQAGYSTTPNTQFKRQIAPNPAPRAPSHSVDPTRPYAYKPKDPLRPNAPHMYVDHQALANQKSFITGSSSAHYQGQQYNAAPRRPSLAQEYSEGGTPLRSFPNEQYYSMKTLPAAYPGEHSTFREAARRQSYGSQTMPHYTPNYQSVREQQAERKISRQGGAPVAQMSMGGSSGVPQPILPANPYASNPSGPPSSSHSYHSPYGAPLTPATTHSVASKSADAPGTDRDYLKSLEKYPYLLQSYCRKPKVYQSPYPLGGGFSSEYQNTSPSQPALRPFQPHHGQHTRKDSDDRPAASSGWTPPSKMWAEQGFTAAYTPPQRVPQYIPAQRPQAVHQSQQDFQRQLQNPSVPSTASRDGAQARLLRDQGYSSFTPHSYPYHRSSFSSGNGGYAPSHGHGNSYASSGGADVAKMYAPSQSYSPKAPTPSPLSDPNTPARTWSHISSQQPQVPYPGYAPAVPHMGQGQGGRTDAWKYC